MGVNPYLLYYAQSYLLYGTKFPRDKKIVVNQDIREKKLWITIMAGHTH